MEETELKKIIKTYSSGRKQEVYFIDKLGRKQGDYYAYYDNEYNSEQLFRTYENGKVSGLVKEWYDNHILMRECGYDKDRLDGECRIYTSQGFLAEIENYKFGYLHGKCRHFEEGEYISSKYYIFGEEVTVNNWEYSKGLIERVVKTIVNDIVGNFR